MIEGISGIEVCRRLRRRPATANVPIIMLTARGEEADRIRGLETGADDYVTKPFSPRELVARVGAVLRRVRPALAGEQLGLCRHRDGRRRPQGAARRPAGRRSARPSSACCATSSNIRGRVFSRERLLDSVWPHSEDIELRTVDVHIRRLRQGDQARRQPDLIRTVRSAGYALDAEGRCLSRARRRMGLAHGTAQKRQSRGQSQPPAILGQACGRGGARQSRAQGHARLGDARSAPSS